MVRKTREQVWRELDSLGEDEVRRRLEGRPAETEEPALVHEWLVRCERIAAELAQSSHGAAAGKLGPRSSDRGVGALAVLAVAAAALGYLAARRRR